jgi:Lrp/AsnC family leucine-responsive transcriptional regulator
MPADSASFSELDRFDKKIIEVLTEDGRISITDLAEV